MRQKIKPQWKGFRYRIFGHTNPEMQRGWVYNTFIENPKMFLTKYVENPKMFIKIYQQTVFKRR